MIQYKASKADTPLPVACLVIIEQRDIALLGSLGLAMDKIQGPLKWGKIWLLLDNKLLDLDTRVACFLLQTQEKFVPHFQARDGKCFCNLILCTDAQIPVIEYLCQFKRHYKNPHRLHKLKNQPYGVKALTSR